MRKSIKQIFVIFSLLLLFVFALETLKYFSGYQIYRDISYGEKEENTMDIYSKSDH